MTTNIKITALNDIGANVAYTTLVPVVDMAGTPTTEKANLQIIGNLFLGGAGGANFVAATRSLTAGSVTNAAQANITSVGTLTGITVSGLTNLGELANITITGGASTNVLSTNGAGVLSWVDKDSGVSGYSGIDGTNGAPGASGYSGIGGAPGLSGYSGIDGTNGAPGLSGYSGIDGAAGSYVPGNAGDWDIPVPTTITQALDRIANAVVTFTSTPIA